MTRSKPGEVVGCEDRGPLLFRKAGHGVMKQRSGGWVLVEILVKRLAVELIEGRPSGLGGMREPALGSPKELITIEPVLRSEPGLSRRSNPAAGVISNNPPFASENTPTLASARRRR